MSKNMQEVEWQDEELEKAVKNLLRIISKEAKEEIWLKYQICFKKCKDGKISVRNPEFKEI